MAPTTIAGYRKRMRDRLNGRLAVGEIIAENIALTSGPLATTPREVIAENVVRRERERLAKLQAPLD